MTFFINQRFEIFYNEKIAIVCGKSNRNLSERICQYLTNKINTEHSHEYNQLIKVFGDNNILGKEPHITIIRETIDTYSNGEIRIQLLDNIRQKDVYIIQSTDLSCDRTPNDNLMELLCIIRACRDSSAKSIIPVIPCLGYQRQDKKDESRTPTGAKLVADLIETASHGTTMKVILGTLHAGQIQSFFNGPVDHLFLTNYLVESFLKYYLQNDTLDNLMVISPDVGGAKINEKIALQLNVPFAILSKHRSVAGSIDHMTLNIPLDMVRSKNLVLFDDMIDTAGTACTSAQTLISSDFGAKSVYFCAVHGILSGKAFDNLANSQFDKIFLTNTLENRIPIDHPINQKIIWVDVAGHFGEAIFRNTIGKSLGEIYEKKMTFHI